MKEEMGKQNSSNNNDDEHQKKTEIRFWYRPKKILVVGRSPQLIIKKYIQELGTNAIKLTTFSSSSNGQVSSNSEDKTTIAQDLIPQLPPEMLVNIFKMLPTAELVPLREVSRSFCSLATSIYRDRKNRPRLFFDCDYYRREYCRCTSSSELKPTNSANRFLLSDFTSMLRSSIDPDNSPFTRFHFELPLKETPDIIDFLELWRSQIKYLSLWSATYYKVQDRMMMNLLSILPNIDSLDLDKELSRNVIISPDFNPELWYNYNCKTVKFDQFLKHGNGESQDSIQFPSLKSLSLSRDFNDGYNVEIDLNGSIVTILKKAVNLTYCHVWAWRSSGLNLGTLTTLISLGKTHTIKEIKVELTKENVKSFARTFTLAPELKLESLVINLFEIYNEKDYPIWNKTTAVLNKLLERQADSLKSLEIEGSIGFLPGLEVSRMDKLSRLKLSSPPNDDFPCLIFPSHVVQDDPTTLFPKLTSVDFDVRLTERRTENKYPWSTFFPPQMKFTNVSTLKLKNGSAEVYFEQLSKLFSGVKLLSFGFRIQNFMENGLNIWNFRSVKVLDLEIDRVQGQNLDCVFTGYPSEFLQQFYEMTDEDLLEEVTNVFWRDWPIRGKSIIDLTDLTTLTINLRVDKNDRPTFSKISWFFALRQMVNLKAIKITVEKGYNARGMQAFDLVNGLQFLEPFVNTITST